MCYPYRGSLTLVVIMFIQLFVHNTLATTSNDGVFSSNSEAKVSELLDNFLGITRDLRAVTTQRRVICV